MVRIFNLGKENYSIKRRQDYPGACEIPQIKIIETNSLSPSEEENKVWAPPVAKFQKGGIDSHMNMHIFDKLKNEPIIAYLSMEIALSSDMPTYSGGWEFWLEIQFVLQPTSLPL